MPCRIARRRLWTHRLLLESYQHADSTVITLTLSNEFGPIPNWLRKDQLQRYLKRVRERLRDQNRKFRYFAVGEYGEETGRPHFHAILFGLHFQADAPMLQDAWRAGTVYLDRFSLEAAQYVCGYVTKKLTNGKDTWTQAKLQGRTPEFSCMSLKPGIASTAMDQLASACARGPISQAIGKSLDVPTVLQHGGSTFALGRYLRQQLRQRLFKVPRGSDGVPEAAKLKKAQDLRTLSEAVGTAKAIASLKLAPEIQRIRNLEARAKLRGKGSL